VKQKTTIFFSPEGITNTIVSKTNKQTLEKATQKVETKVITRRRALHPARLKNLVKMIC
jgi:hypothetical protein